MEDAKMSEEERVTRYGRDAIRAVHKEREGETGTGTDSAWMKRHFSDSIYLWACGEKADDEDDGPQLSERLIAWLILFMQGFAYATLITLAKTIKEDSEESSNVYLVPAAVGAIYLLVASTTHDLRDGFALLVDGLCAGHRAFGIGLLIVHGIMISAAMTVIVANSDDSENVVLNAVTVLFIADLDEKALKLFLTLPRQWRLFWAIYSIGISFVLALIAIYHVGSSTNIFEDHSTSLKEYESWFFWMLNPAAVTMLSYRLSACLQGFSESCSEAFEQVDQVTLRYIVGRGFRGVLAAIKRGNQAVREEPCFYAALAVWLVQGVVSWWMLVLIRGLIPVALTVYDDIDDSGSDDIKITKEYFTFIFTNAVLVAGLAMKALGAFLPRRDSITVIQEPRRSCHTNGARKGCGSCADSRVPSLLVGWGIGYWVTSLILVLGVSWDRGGWQDAPLAVSIIGYVFIPCCFVAGVFMVADTNFMGRKVEALIKPAIEIMRDRRRFVYWTIATVVFRDALLAWLYVCVVLLLDLQCIILAE